MSDQWNATEYAAKDNLLRVVRGEAEALFEMAAAQDAWERRTACTLWRVRDIVGHLIDVTESYFTGFDAATSGGEVPAALGLKVMADRLNEGARAHRELTQDAALGRLRADFAKLMEICQALGPDEWAGQQVAHKYMGPLPAFFYPVFQLMDYGVHGWDIRQGTGRAHGLAADTADLLVPFMFILWQATAEVSAGTEPVNVGIRISGRNACDYLVSVSSEGLEYTPEDVSGLPAVIEFDPGSLVLTAFGRVNAGTIIGDRAVADAFLNSFFRI
ncbi:MAG: maleylpyruvate isomerase N-terminal domain-containing protein [Streptosporangiaceae bacterium]|nr:maleylpyruvate isomerase N-terminal domain-containing protein [Streptosporangiaceae bacterium]MBV9854590.1 maleylpyruvate isomerase N-terminal domain-containing protein [Streptosporangiaceae bacterium]